MSEKFAFCLLLVRLQGGIEDQLKVVVVIVGGGGGRGSVGVGLGHGSY
jgi:hypothetical protein